MSILPKASYKFSGIPINISIALFNRSRKEHLKFIWNDKRTQITKKSSKWTRQHISWFQTKQRHGFDPWVGKSPGEGNGNPLQYSCLKNSLREEPGGRQFIELHRIRHDWAAEQRQTYDLHNSMVLPSKDKYTNGTESKAQNRATQIRSTNIW